MKQNLSVSKKDFFNKETFSDYSLILIGSVIQSIGMAYFLIPARLISGGVSGLAQVINAHTGWPIGGMTLIGNIPLFIFGWRYLGKRKFAIRTVFSVVLFSFFTDLLTRYQKNAYLTHDIFLNTLFGAVILGIGFGLVYRGSGTSGGTDIIGRILNQRAGLPITQSYLLTDSVSVILGGLTFGWDLALYGLIAIYVSGVAAETISEGANFFRDVVIITDKPDAIAEGVINVLEHSVTLITGIGGYSKEKKGVIYCVINRGEINQLKRLVVEVDPKAFMVVGQANEVMGEGFQKYKYLED
ncbi:MAG TPA: YitT family protein [Flexilinea sp.]|jgi:uncharacterized membrane-anchored protein YitT (DUF2179 family)|nr:YitT family protein [Flexilinea sp.]OQA28389.1 MAG: hypothetical protein BWY58_00426 [Chloroflexi bacterium ADurb.Bin344]HNY93105.1 YitT family protein [Flexilinea sp.]HOG21431.1 YitT family protein [Flexilinea sp.]HOP01015.1 YitT family protein [Flexilinea sp.]